MSAPDDSFYNIKKLHVVFALSSAALLGVTVWMVIADHGRGWKVYQRTFQGQVEPWRTEAELRREESRPYDARDLAEHRATVDRLRRTLRQQRSTWGRKVLELPFIDALGKPLSIHQLWLPELTINYNYCSVARFDRCMTCHVAIDKTEPELASAPACLPQPYVSHPRLDLFLGSASPHPMSEFGCTICHDGQGSATEFTFASHTPNGSAQRHRWRQQHGWYQDRYWDLPMRAKRFTESSCLRCHPEVTDLEPSERFADPPAPKLVEGYQLVCRHGCFGCHEIRGVLDSGKRVGPDLRLEPNYHEAALEFLADPGLNDSARQLARDVIAHPEDVGPRHQLVASLQDADARRALRAYSQKMVRLLAAEHPNPGTMRKVGPSLRDVGGKLSAEFLQSWISKPSQFRPDTRMPQFFGMHGHLDGKSLEDTKRFEAVEVRAVAEYLIGASQPVSPLVAPSQVTEPPSAARGKRLYLIKGCAACHKHEDFPDVTSVQGPALTNLGSKITTEAGRRWLVSWIRNPARYSPRTVMPNALLEPVRLDSEERAGGTPRWTDPAADIAAYLLKSDGWKPEAPAALVEADLDELALTHLSRTFPLGLARQYLAKGIPESIAAEVQEDARELIGRIDLEKRLRYVGRRTIRKRGCFGCHDIPGFENAQPIGPALSDWGRKQTSLLAFGQAHAYVTTQATGGGLVERSPESARGGVEKIGRSPATLTPGPSPASGRGEASARNEPDREFYLEAIRGHDREGLLWQKLRDPRSFDYKIAENKTFNEQLLMGRFALTDNQWEAIATFVLGLVADPPTARYVCRPEHRRRAIVEGRKVLDKYGCAECHTLAFQRWTFAFDPAKFEDPISTPDFALTKPWVAPAVLASSRQLDQRGLGQAEVVGVPRVDAHGQLATDENDDGDQLNFFTLWEPAAINGKLWAVGGADVPIAASRILQKRVAWGGALARLLYPTVLREARTAGAATLETEGWGWMPPPLVHEGAAVQPSWLFDYLLNPVPIRPAVVLRMPRYAMSPGEASTLVDYFAAVSGVAFPYTASSGGLTTPSANVNSERMDQAMRLVTDRTTYCAKCHWIGDFSPGGDVQTILAPNLDRVGRRIRPEYLRRWLANPKSVLPYTPMPVNFPPEGPPVGQELLKGTSLEQLEAVEGLLLDYDTYMKHRVSIREMIDAATRPGADSKDKSSGKGS